MRGEKRPGGFEAFDVVTTPVESGITLIEASAGTGKTFALTTLAVRMLLGEEIQELREVLLVTFTEKATAELKARLRSRLVETIEVLEGRRQDEVLQRICDRAGALSAGPVRDRAVLRLQLALSAFDEVRVQTLHAFCGQLLRESAFELGETFSAEFVESAIEVEAQALVDTWRSFALDAPAWWADLIASSGLKLDLLKSDFRTVLNHRDADFGDSLETVAEFQRRARALFEELSRTVDRQEMIRRLDSVKKWLKSAKEKGLDQRIRAKLEGVEPVDTWLLGQMGPQGWVQESSAADRRELLPWFEEDPVGRRLAAWAELVAELPRVGSIALWRGARERYATIKARDNLLDYDDLIEGVYRSVQDPARSTMLRRRVQTQLKVALIDEFQDTDRRQWTIFESLFAGQRLVLVGDPKQAIYAFRGADVRTYLRASRSAGCRTTLERNYRSHPELVAAVDLLFGRFVPSFGHEEIRFPHTTGALDPREVSLRGDDRPPFLFDVLGKDFVKAPQPVVEREILHRVVREISRMVENPPLLGSSCPTEERPLNAGDVAVLVRKRSQGIAVVEALRQAGVSAVLAQPGDIYESAEMRDLELVLRAVLQPRRAGLRQRAAATLLWGATLEESFEAVGVGEGATRGGEWAELLQQLQRLWREKGFIPMCGELLERRRVRQRLLCLEDGERRWTNVQHAVEILDRDALEGHLDANALLRWIGRQRGQSPDDDRRQLRLERDREAVQVVTVHKCKGLEFEVVLCPFLYGAVAAPKTHRVVLLQSDRGDASGRFLLRVPSVAAQARDAALRALLAEAEFESLAEDLRLVYVAVTRARRRCVVWTGATGKDASRSALSFLLHASDRPEGMSASQWWQQCQEAAAAAWADPVGVMERLCEESSGRWGLLGENAQAGPRVEATTTSEAGRPLRAAAFPPGRRLERERVVSFTSWTRESGHFALRDHLDPSEEEGRVTVSPRGIFAFSRGARAGLCLHEILERVPWAESSTEDRQSSIRTILRRYGLDRPEAHSAELSPVASVEEMLERVAKLRVPTTALRFADLPAEDRRAEWAFDADLGRVDRVSPRRLARVFRTHGQAGWVEEFTARLDRLPPRQVRGVLTGFVDLIYRVEGRWWVLDWKSNHLGNGLADYDAVALERSMLEHDYFLQSHLYLVALHRHLRRCVTDYDPATHLGGSIYVYLRGLDESGESGCVVEAASAKLIDALDAALDGDADRSGAS